MLIKGVKHIFATRNNKNAQLAELVDALVSNTCGKPCRFDSGAGTLKPLYESREVFWYKEADQLMWMLVKIYSEKAT